MEALLQALSTPEGLISLATLTFMEIVLGVDNLVFLTIVSGRLPDSQQPRARRIGLFLALGMRIALLFSISWLVQLKTPLFEIGSFHPSWKDLILLGGGLFLIAKATSEIHHKLEGKEEEVSVGKGTATFGSVLVQIVLLDIIFSIDSILTAVGLVEVVGIMILAVVISMIVMIVFVNVISDFINQHPTMKMLALSFLILIGVMLVAESFHQEIPKGYIYFAIFFSLGVEMLNMRIRTAKKAPVALRAKMKD